MKNPLIVIFGIALIFTACTSAPATPETVQITLNEFGIVASISEFEVGQTYYLKITNSGALNHEFVIVGQEVGMPNHDMGDMGHDMSGSLLHVPQDQLTPGTIILVEFTFTQTLDSTPLEFACHLPGHYEAGMFLPISVDG